MVVDVSSPQTPVIYASPSVEITKEIIELYDKKHGVRRRSGAHANAPAQASRGHAAPKPAPAKPAGQ
jgi:outer membrane protein